MRTANDLGLYVRQGASGLRGIMAFNTERFGAELVARAAMRVVQLVRAIAIAPATRVADLPRRVD
jgi:hypothetical protein